MDREKNLINIIIMILRTTFSIEPSDEKISYSTPVLFTGSCFASEIGKKMAEAKMKVMINPAGTVYNPISIGNTLDIILNKRIFNRDDIFCFNNLYHSFYHYTDFTSDDPFKTLEKINLSTALSHEFLKNASFLFITFGTARVYRFKETGMIVSNCHKLPASMFTSELLDVDEIYSFWRSLIKRLKEFNRNLKIIFTISPVRYLKDGAHGNQISKSVLFLATEKLLSDTLSAGYFPAYELLMDDLRDYRFYADDMIHPSSFAIDYIFEAFSGVFFEKETISTYKEIMEIVRAKGHRIISPASEQVKKFAGIMLEKISSLEQRISDVDFTDEKNYFSSLSH